MKRLKTFPNELLPLKADLCISIVIDLDTASAYSEKDAVALSNFLKEAEKEATAKGINLGLQLEQVRNHSRELLNHTGSLLLYITKEDVVYYHIRQDVQDKLVVGSSPFVKPLIQYYQYGKDYQVLVLNQDHARLFVLDGDALEEVTGGEWPIELKDALGDEIVGGELTHGTYGSRGTDAEQTYHGHNETSKEKEIDRENFFRYVDNTLNETNKEETLPVILFALAENQAAFRNISKYKGLLDKGLETSGAQLSDLDISKQVLDYVAQTGQNHKEEVLNRMKETSPEFRLEQLDELSTIAKEGRVEELLVSSTLALDEDGVALDLVKDVMETAGTVYIVQPEDLATGVEVSGRLRY